jgi:nucleoid-associated protein EbfC
MLKQLEQMQADLMKAQQNLSETTVEGTAGGGAVVLVMTGDQGVQSLTIDPEFVDPEDVETLQDAIVAAFNDAQRKVQELTQQTLGPLAGGLGLPGMP